MNDDFEEDAECKEEVIGAEVAGAEVVEEVEEAKEEEAEEGALNEEVAKEDVDFKEDEAVKEEAAAEELVAVAVVVVAEIVGSRLGGRTTMVITRSTPHKASKMWLRLSGTSSSSRDKSDGGGGFLESCPILKMSRLPVCCVLMYARSLRRSTLQIRT
jgi:hypothetical protein